MIIQDTNRIKKYFDYALNAGEKFEEVNPEFCPRAEINNSRISQYFSTPETETVQKIFVNCTVKIKYKNFSSNPQNRIEKYFRKNQSDFSTQNFNRLKISVLVEFKTAQGFSLHKYLYCANNPINNTDPSGQFMAIGGLNELQVTSLLIGIVQKIAVATFIGVALDITIAKILGTEINLYDTFKSNIVWGAATLGVGWGLSWGYKAFKIQKILEVGTKTVASLAPSGFLAWGTQGRICKSIVEKWANLMKQGKWKWDKMKDPITYYVNSSGKKVIREGHHRVIAAQLAGESIPSSAFKEVTDYTIETSWSSIIWAP